MIDCFCDYDPPSFYWQRSRKARKKHECDECGRNIVPGETYEVVTAKWPDYSHRPDTFKTCSHCVEMRTFVKNSVPCFCWLHHTMRDDIRDAVESAYERARDEVRGLAFRIYRMEIARRRFAEQARPA